MDDNRDHGHWSDQMKSGLKRLLAGKTFCDVTLKVGDRTFDCHKNILSCFSRYFSAMFDTAGMQESTGREVTLQWLDSSVVEMLIKYIYEEYIDITEHNILGLLEAATYLQMDGFLASVDLLNIDDCINNDNFWELWSQTVAHPDCHFLEPRLREYLLRHFEQLWLKKGFEVNLQHHDLLSVLRSPSVTVSSEDELLRSVISWLEHDIEDRKEDMCVLLEAVRLPLCTEANLLYLKEHFEVHMRGPLIGHLKLAEKYHKDNGGQMNFTTEQTEYRKQSGKEKVIIFVTRKSADGERPSVWYYSMNRKKLGYLSEVPCNIQCFTSCTYGESDLYLFGSRPAASNVFLHYSVVSDRWETLDPSPDPHCRMYADIVSIKDKIYLFGGQDTDEMDPSLLSSVYVFDVPSGCWQEEPFCHLEVPVVMMVSSSIGDNIYVMGGQTVPILQDDIENLTEFIRKVVVQCIDTTQKSCSVVGQSDLITNMIMGASAYSCNADDTIHMVVKELHSNQLNVIKFDPTSSAQFERVDSIPTVSLDDLCMVTLARSGRLLIVCSPAFRPSYLEIGHVVVFDMTTGHMKDLDHQGGLDHENIFSCHFLVLAENQLL